MCYTIMHFLMMRYLIKLSFSSKWIALIKPKTFSNKSLLETLSKHQQRIQDDALGLVLNYCHLTQLGTHLNTNLECLNLNAKLSSYIKFSAELKNLPSRFVLSKEETQLIIDKAASE